MHQQCQLENLIKFLLKPERFTKSILKNQVTLQKMAEVDARIDHPEDAEGVDLGVQLKAALFERVEGIDFTFFRNNSGCQI